MSLERVRKFFSPSQQTRERDKIVFSFFEPTLFLSFLFLLRLLVSKTKETMNVFTLSEQRRRGKRVWRGGRVGKREKGFLLKKMVFHFFLLLLSRLLSIAMPSKKKADDDGDVSFEISAAAPASQTSIVVDDAWTSEKEKRSKEKMRWSSEPKKQQRKVEIKFFFSASLSSFLRPLLLTFSLSHTLSLSTKQQNAEAVLVALVMGRLAIETVRWFLERRRKRRRGGAAPAA